MSSLIIAARVCMWLGRALLAEYIMVADDYVWDDYEVISDDRHHIK